MDTVLSCRRERHCILVAAFAYPSQTQERDKDTQQKNIHADDNKNKQTQLNVEVNKKHSLSGIIKHFDKTDGRYPRPLAHFRRRRITQGSYPYHIWSYHHPFKDRSSIPKGRYNLCLPGWRRQKQKKAMGAGSKKDGRLTPWPFFLRPFYKAKASSSWFLLVTKILPPGYIPILEASRA